MQISDFIDASRVGLSEDKEFVDVARALENSAPWKKYCEVLNRIVNSLGESVLAPLPDQDAIYAQEFNKGTMRGLLLAITLPKVTLEQAAEQLPEEGEE
jgi:hypothetical protein